MAKSGSENPQASEVIIPFGSRRVHPPESLSDDARRAFTDLVLSLPVAHFKLSDVPLLCRWSELTALAERSALEMTQSNGLVTVEWRPSAWFSIHAQSVKALSGLARAFFYAGARALLVTHWSVASESATRLTTSTFGIMKSNPAIGRAEGCAGPWWPT